MSKYYAIYKQCEIGTCYEVPQMVVEKEEVAKDICKRFPQFYYCEYELLGEER